MGQAPFIEAAVEEVSALIGRGERRIDLNLRAGPERTAALERLHTSLESQRRQVVHVDMPMGDDASMVGLTLSAAQLEKQDPELLGLIESPDVPWKEKLERVQAAAAKASEAVFLVEDSRFPEDSPVSSAYDEELFTRYAAQVANMLRDVPGTVVRAGPSTLSSLAKKVSSVPSHEASTAPVVQQVLEALAAAGVPVHAIPRRYCRLQTLFARDLSGLVAADAALRRALLRLSVLRKAFPVELVTRLVGPELSATSRRVLDLLLSTTADGMHTLHPALGHLIHAHMKAADPAWQVDEPITEMHRLAAEHHRAEFERSQARGARLAALRHDLEEVYHLCKAGDTALLSRKLWFAEYYDALGRALSVQASRVPRENRQQEEVLRRQAIQAYERALEYNEHDAYARHYIAHNLDIIAADPARAEQEYVAARDLDPKHAWYHSRYVRFLITTVWMKEAREAWEQAFDALGSSLGPLEYKELHGEVARLLLHRGELEFAREVLEDVPEETRGSAWWRALMRLLVYLEEERDERLVFPPNVPLEERWDRPHLVPEEAVHLVKAWRPGRVVDRDERDVHIRVATRDAGGGKESISYVHLNRWRLKNTWSSRHHLLPTGTFVELLEYKNGSCELKAWSDRESEFHDADLPKLFPSPDRYIRRGFARP